MEEINTVAVIAVVVFQHGGGNKHCCCDSCGSYLNVMPYSIFTTKPLHYISMFRSATVYTRLSVGVYLIVFSMIRRPILNIALISVFNMKFQIQ